MTRHEPGLKEVTMTGKFAVRTGRGWPSVLVGLASLAVLIAGCSGSGSTGPGNAPVASLGTTSHAGNGSAPALTQEQSDQDMIHFARCMRANGVAMQDPFHRPGHAGLSIDMPGQNASNQHAYAVCTHFIEPIVAMKNAGATALAAPRLAALTRYAECMRSHDIAMLDPDPEGNLNLGRIPGISSAFGRYSPQFRAADQACRHFLPAGVHDDGTGP